MKTTRTRRLLALTILACTLTVSLAIAQKDDQAEVLMQAAQQKQLVEGRLDEAIQLYKRVLQEHSGNRPAAAQALLEMGECYEKLGNTEATKAYERLLRDYGDQDQAVAAARKHLAVLGQPVSGNRSEMGTRRVWAGPGWDVLGSVSLDGRHMSYVDWTTGDLALLDLGTGKTRHVTDQAESYGNAFFSAISPDGKQVAFEWSTDASAELRLAGLDGSATRVLSKEAVIPNDWSPDGKYLLCTVVRTGGEFPTQIALVSVTDGAVHVLKSFDRLYPGKMRFSPDGRYIAYDYPPHLESDNRDIFLLTVDGSRDIPLVEHPGEDELLGWTPDGNNILFTSDRSGSMSAWIVPVAEGKAAGPPELVKQDIGLAQPIGFTRSGSYYYSLEIGTSDIYTADFDAGTGKVVSQPQKATQRFVGWNTSPAWSPDGQFLAYLSSRRQGIFEHQVISIRSLKTGEERDLSPNIMDLWGPLRWSPDSQSILVPGKDKKILHGTYLVDVRTGEIKSTVQSDPNSEISHPAWFPDGKRLLYADIHSDSGTITEAVVILDLQTARKTELFRASPGSKIDDIALSSDGRLVALAVVDKGTQSTALKVLSVGGGDVSELIRAKEPEAIVGDSLSWSGDSRYIIFGKSQATGQKIQLLAIASSGGEPHALGLAMDSVHNFTFDTSGHHVAFAAGRARSEVWVIENFLPTPKTARPPSR